MNLLHQKNVKSVLNTLQEAGFKIEKFYEPDPESFSDKQTNSPERYYSKFRASLVASTMVFDCKLI